jgi:hypothetical protein
MRISRLAAVNQHECRREIHLMRASADIRRNDPRDARHAAYPAADFRHSKILAHACA